MPKASRKRGATIAASPGRHYPNAPIAEAVIDLQTRFVDESGPSRFDSLKRALVDQFPIATPFHAFEFKLGVKNPHGLEARAQADTKTSQTGWRLSTKEAKHILLLQNRGFTYSHLPPYSDWETFRGECSPLWAQFVAACAPILVTRIAVRFVNQIRIPLDRFESDEYFTLYPHVPEGIPQDMQGMFMQLGMPQPDLTEGTAATINFGLIQKERPGETSVLLDLDVSAEVEFKPDSPEIWTLLDKFRTRKNLLFEAFITDKTRELFK